MIPTNQIVVLRTSHIAYILTRLFGLNVRIIALTFAFVLAYYIFTCIVTLYYFDCLYIIMFFLMLLLLFKILDITFLCCVRRSIITKFQSIGFSPRRFRENHDRAQKVVDTKSFFRTLWDENLFSRNKCNSYL